MAVLAILALHGAAAWGLMQVDAVRAAVAEAAPLFVDLIAPPAPERAPEPPAPPPPQIRKPPPPAVVIAAPPAPSPAPAPFVVPEPPPEPAPPAPPQPPVVVVAAPAPPAPPQPQPTHELPASAIQYLDPPDPVYPRASRRLNEAGEVIVRVYVGSDGLPRQLQVLKSSGFPRLDEAALEGVRRARFKPPTENGRPTAGWARIPIPFELEK